MVTAAAFRKWKCLNCGFVYDEEHGAPEDGVASGTCWDDVPDDWFCPQCGANKTDFEMVKI
jgi:rubredoxin